LCDGFIEDLIKERIVKETVSNGPLKFEGIGHIDAEFPAIRLNILKVEDYKTYPFLLLYWTGSTQFNIDLRKRAKRMGLHLGNQYLADSHGRHFTVRNEEEIFKLLGMEYLPPHERQF
jgi:DNA polymerase/3'-5' exonuclease PolX